MMKSTLSWVARRSTALIVSAGWLRSSYSISSTLRWPALSLSPPRSLTSCAQSLKFGQWVTAAPAAMNPVFGPTTPIRTVSWALAAPIPSDPAKRGRRGKCQQYATLHLSLPIGFAFVQVIGRGIGTYLTIFLARHVHVFEPRPRSRMGRGPIEDWVPAHATQRSNTPYGCNEFLDGRGHRTRHLECPQRSCCGGRRQARQAFVASGPRVAIRLRQAAAAVKGPSGRSVRS